MKRFIIFLIAVLINSTAFAQGWEWQNPLPQGNDLYDVSTVWDAYGGTGWMVGAGGTLLITDGVSYNQRSDLGDGLRAVYTTDRDHAWIVGSSSCGGTIFHTSDRGLSWVEQWCDSTLGPTEIFMLTNEIGWATAWGGWWFNAAVLRTTDGGTTWTTQMLDSTTSLYNLSFVNENLGWVAGDGFLARTTDGGETWETLDNPTYGVRDLFFMDSLNGCLLDILRIYMTHDGGQTWQQTEYARTWINHVEFAGTQLGLVSGNDGLMLRTTDGGETWDSVATNTHEEINSIDFHPYPWGQAVGNNGLMMWTGDGGEHWSIQTTNRAERTALQRVSISQAGSGWAIGGNDIILRTTDGGNHWTNQTTAWSLPFHDVTAVSPDSAFLVGDGGGIFLTTNGGENWLPQYSGTSSRLFRASFVNSRVGWAGAGPGEILRTQDRGIHWEILENEPGLILKDMVFVDENTGWIVCHDWGNMGEIRRTTDGGVTWEIQVSANDTFFYSCHFLDAANGWVGGMWSPDPEGLYYNVLLHTTDGGESWVPQTVNEGAVDDAVVDVVFADLLFGWALTEDGLYVTNNGGENWYSQDTPATQRLWALTENGPHSVWAVGGNGAILHWSGTNSIEPPRALVPQELALEAYPNPFNPTTTIAYDVPKAGHISLRVFDLLGREVAVLKDGMMEVGTHRVMFDGSGLASGIYFTRLDAGAFSQTKKLMLLK